MTPDIPKLAASLSEAQRRNLFALPPSSGVFSTISEMRSQGATGAGMDVLHCMNSATLTERRFVTWGSEPGQKRGCGYEYAIRPLGLAVRNHLLQAEREGRG